MRIENKADNINHHISVLEHSFGTVFDYLADDLFLEVSEQRSNNDTDELRAIERSLDSLVELGHGDLETAEFKLALIYGLVRRFNAEIDLIMKQRSREQ